MTLHRTVSAGADVNGSWNVEVERAGLYQIALRRWPEEAGTPIRRGLPEYKARVATFPAGKALPVREARLAVGEYAGSVEVGPDDEAAVFEVRLAPGKMRLQTWFYDQAGNELCGAYHVRVDYAGAQAFE